MAGQGSNPPGRLRVGPKRPEETRVEKYLVKPARQRVLKFEVKHLYGPKKIPPGGGEDLVVVCLVRDGEPYVGPFVEHYRALGAGHIVFLDNGSADATVAEAGGHEGVTVLRSSLPYKQYKYLFKQYLHARFGKNRWSLYVDIDEFFDYPYSDVLGIGSLLGYLNSKGYTAVAAQMLDMFPERPLTSGPANGGGSLKDVHRFYDISKLWRSSIKQNPRLRGNQIEREEIETFSGGIRSILFDVAPNLTKFPLVFSDGKVTPSNNSSHKIDGARVADFSTVLYHYKFLEHFQEQARRAVREGNYFADSFQYKRYLEVLERSPELRIKQETSRELESVDDLIEQAFLFVSEDYAGWADAEEEKRAPQTTAGGTAREPSETLLRARRRERRKGRELGELARRLAEREREARVLRRELRQLQKRQDAQGRDGADSGSLARQVDDLQRQISAIQNSKGWRFLTALHRAKARVLGSGKRMP